MTTFQIKLIAILTMTLDHIGLYFFPDIFVLRVIGRLSFPLFAFLIANGAIHTRNMNSYLKRLFLFAIISQLPFYLVNGQINSSFWGLNIFVTLFLGLLAIYVIKKTENIFFRVTAVFLAGVLATVLQADYGVVGVLSIVSFYLSFKSIKRMVIQQILIFTLPYVTYVFMESSNGQILASSMLALVQPLAVFSLLFISQYNGKEGIRLKYFFYLFYPLHLFAIYYIKLIF